MTPNNPLAFVIEDDPKQADIFSQALQQAGYDTEIIQDGQAALERLTEIVPFLIILDMHLPFVSGEAILRQIRADERTAKTRVMIATANPQMAIPLEEDSDFILLKPVSFVQLRLLAKRLHPQNQIT